MLFPRIPLFKRKSRYYYFLFINDEGQVGPCLIEFVKQFSFDKRKRMSGDFVIYGAIDLLIKSQPNVKNPKILYVREICEADWRATDRHMKSFAGTRTKEEYDREQAQKQQSLHHRGNWQ